jgi:hypothetical protein
LHEDPAAVVNINVFDVVGYMPAWVVPLGSRACKSTSMPSTSHVPSIPIELATGSVEGIPQSVGVGLAVPRSETGRSPNDSHFAPPSRD